MRTYHSTLLIGVVLNYFIALTSGSCSEGQTCVTSTGKTGLCLRRRCLASLNLDVRENMTFVITVKYPETTLQKHGGRSFYMRGNGLGLNWIKGKQLRKTSHDTWQIQIDYRSSIDGFQCRTCLDQSFLENGKLQYRVLIDDLTDMRGANFAVTLPLAKSSQYFDTKPEITVYPWFFSKTGSSKELTIESPQIGGNRSISVLFPPSFTENTYKTYAVLFVPDMVVRYSQLKPYVFDGLMVEHGVTVEFVVIGFSDYKSPQDSIQQNSRATLLTTPVGSEMKCANGTISNRCNNCYLNTTIPYSMAWFQVLKDKCGYRYYTGGKADDTIDFLLDTVYTKVQNISLNRLSTKRNDLGFMGYSHGGLAACHAAWTRPERVGFAACMSPSFWWPFNNVTWTTCDFNFINRTLKDPRYLHNRPPQKIYLDTGGAEADEPYMTKQVVIETAQYLDTLDYFTLNKNLWVNIFPGEIHSFYYWLKRLWRPLSVLLPAPGSPRMPQASGLPVIG